MFSSPFNQAPQIQIPDDTDIVFVSDMFVEDYVGGAELTTEALITSSPFKVFKLHSKDVNVSLLEQGHRMHWVFGNFTAMDSNLIPTVCANMSYSVLEYDYKFCRYRSMEKHASIEQEKCRCHTEITGKMISAFYYAAKSLWWMSESQMEIYHSRFAFLSEKPNVVLSSVFDDKFFLALKILKERYKDHERKGWVVLGSTSWIKGADAAEQWCKDNNHDYEVLWDVPYEEVLEKLAQAEGFVYLPEGGDTCPRMVIEAKLLGCKLHINDHVQHAKELWFETEDPFDTEAYLYAARERFWSGIKHAMNWAPKLSGYTTTLDCINHDYPWKASVGSMLGFCHEVVVVDGGSTDGTWEKLQEWAETEPRLKIHQEIRDWDSPRFAVFDGLQKAVARSICTGEFCWQQDADEVVHEDDYEKIYHVLRTFPTHIDILSLPVVEYWGTTGKVRVDVNPWKWRVSRNKDGITHGIPAELRRWDENGSLYAALGTDGCDYIDANSYDRLGHASFYTMEVHELRMAATAGNEDALEKYREWFSRVIEMLPGVQHYSWFNLERKIKTYQNYWSRHWQSLYNVGQEDTSENNMFFGKPWTDVNDIDIKDLAKKLEDEMGGWIFHQLVDFSNPTPWTELDREHPEVVKGWARK